MDKKKVTYVITKANWGGAQRYVYDLATHVPREEFDVSVIYGTPGLLTDKLKDTGTTVYRSESLGRDVSATKDARSFFEIYRLFKKIRPDVVHLNSSKAGGVGALAARMAGVPRIIFTAHGWPFWEQHNPMVRAVLWFLSYLTALMSHTVICISNYDIRQVRYMPGVHAVRIYNGIEPVPLGSGEIVRRTFPPGVKIVGTIGELTANKNHIALIEAARRNPNLYVAVVGDGELSGWLQQKIAKYRVQDRVKLFGFIPYPEVLKGFDVFSLPSIKEGLPYVLLQAKLAGLPIEANRVGGVGEILDAPDMSEFTLGRMIEKTTALYR